MTTQKAVAMKPNEKVSTAETRAKPTDGGVCAPPQLLRRDSEAKRKPKLVARLAQIRGTRDHALVSPPTSVSSSLTRASRRSASRSAKAEKRRPSQVVAAEEPRASCRDARARGPLMARLSSSESNDVGATAAASRRKLAKTQAIATSAERADMRRLERVLARGL